MHKYVMAAVASAFIYSAVTVAQLPPMDVRGVPLGASVAELQSKIPGFECVRTECSFSVRAYTGKQCRNSGDLECLRKVWSTTDFGTVHVRYYLAEFRDDKLGRIVARVDQEDLDELVIGLTKKYGAPTSDSVKQVQNPAGATLENRMVTWERPDGSIKVQQRYAYSDECAVIISSKEFGEAASR
jgi:hypothetical protein